MTDERERRKETADTREEDLQAGGDDDDNRQQEEDADVVDGAAVDVARGAYLPDAVESCLDVGGQAVEGVEQHDKAHTDEHAAARPLQVGVDKVHDGLCHLRREIDIRLQLLLDELSETETAGDGKHDGQDGHGTEDAGVGQRCGMGRQVAIEEQLHRQNQPPNSMNEDAGGQLPAAIVEAPQVSVTE